MIFTQFVAVSILLMHSFVPHHHHSELSFEQNQEEHQNADGIIDFLALAFHFDHQEGQMEEFTVAQSDFEFDEIQLLDFATVSNNDLYESVFNKTKGLISYTPRKLAKRVDLTRSLRAPPSIS